MAKARGFSRHLVDVNGTAWPVTDEMASHVQKYIDYVRAFKAPTLIEQRLSIASITGEIDAGGTADAVIFTEGTLAIVDLKYGKGVRVAAEDNEQLQIYAAAALIAFKDKGPFSTVHIVISQPRLNHLSEWTVSVSHLRDNIRGMMLKARKALIYLSKTPDELTDADFAPGTKQCRFCVGKAICPALNGYVLSTVANKPINLAEPVMPQIAAAVSRPLGNSVLANLLSAVDLIEAWCRSIKDKARYELARGNDVPGLKLVEGRRGARRWTDAREAEKLLKAARVPKKDRYTTALISPAGAEKLYRSGALGSASWQSLSRLYEQPQGAPILTTTNESSQECN